MSRFKLVFESKDGDAHGTVCGNAYHAQKAMNAIVGAGFRGDISHYGFVIATFTPTNYGVTAISYNINRRGNCHDCTGKDGCAFIPEVCYEFALENNRIRLERM